MNAARNVLENQGATHDVSYDAFFLESWRAPTAGRGGDDSLFTIIEIEGLRDFSTLDSLFPPTSKLSALHRSPLLKR